MELTQAALAIATTATGNPILTSGVFLLFVFLSASCPTLPLSHLLTPYHIQLHLKSRWYF